MPEILLQCKDIMKIYESKESKVKIPALRGIDLTIRKGDLMAIIGASGEGKTTLVNIIGMLDRPTSGEIVFTNERLGKIKYSKQSFKKLARFRRKIFGYVFQQPEQNIFTNLTVWENMMFTLRLQGNSRGKDRKQHIKRILSILNIYKLRNQVAKTLSGGEAQRLSVAMALANNPPIVLADEPTGELDSLNTYAMIKLFQELNQELGTTFIVVTHDQRFHALTKHTYSIQDGKISSLYRANNHNDPNSREKFTYISQDGTCLIPAELRNKYNIDEIVRIEEAEDHIKLYPVKE